MSSRNRHKCKCDICTKWSPLHRRIMAKLRGKDRKLFEEFLIKEACQSDDLGVANAKLDGVWPGWEWMRVAIPKMFATPKLACPCLHITPCQPNCTCVHRFSSAGCLRCCSYGSKEQQRRQAERLAKLID